MVVLVNPNSRDGRDGAPVIRSDPQGLSKYGLCLI